MPLYSSDTLVFNTREVSIAPTEPSAKAAGDVWWEIEANNSAPKYDFSWVYDGTYWRSPERRYEQSINARMFANPENVGFFFDARSDVNYFFKELAITLFTTVTHDALNNLQIALQRRLANNTATTIGTVSTAGAASGSWIRRTLTVNAPVNVSATNTRIFALYLTSTGFTGNNFMSLSASYVHTRV